MSVTITDLVQVVKRDIYPVLIDSYDSEAPIYPELCEVMPCPTDGSLLGAKGSVITTVGDFERREIGELSGHDRLRDAYTWRCKIYEYSKVLSYDERELSAINAAGKITSDMLETAQAFGSKVVETKDKQIAGLLQKGTLTAGSLVYFDNSYPGEADSNPGFIYDGLPWFDTAHTLAGAPGTTLSNHTVSGALSSTTLEAQRILTNFTSAKDERNNQIMIRHNKLVVPPALERLARVLVESPIVPGSSNNDVNTLYRQYEVLVHPYLSDAASSAAWWTGVAKKMARVYDSGAPRVRVRDAGKGRVEVVYDFFFGATVINWRMASCANKAAA